MIHPDFPIYGGRAKEEEDQQGRGLALDAGCRKSLASRFDVVHEPSLETCSRGADWGADHLADLNLSSQAGG